MKPNAPIPDQPTRRDLLRIVEGLDLPISGAPVQTIFEGAATATAALIGDDYPGLRPRLCVEVGDRVVLGQVLFEDKKLPNVRFTSPASGVIQEVNRGARRALQSVVVAREGDAEERFAAWDAAELATLRRDQIIDNLCASGLWTALRGRPFGRVADPATIPSAIFVTATDTNPLAVRPAVVIDGRLNDFRNGLSVVARLAEGPVHLCCAPDHAIPKFDIPNLRTTTFSGPHPSGLVGTHIHFLHPVGPDRVVWHLGYQDVISIGTLFTTGRLNVDRVVALAGPQVENPRLIRTRIVANIVDLTGGELRDGTSRIVSGSVLSGRRAQGPHGYLGRYHTQISVLGESGGSNGDTAQSSPFSSYRPRWLSQGRSQILTTALHGASGPLIPLGAFDRVTPLDILPTPLLRALLVGDIEMAQGLGCLELEEEDLALCGFVCPGKIDYGAALRTCLDAIERGE